MEKGTYFAIITLFVLVFAGAIAFASDDVIKSSEASIEEVIEEEVVEEIVDTEEDIGEEEGVEEEELVEIVEPTPVPTQVVKPVAKSNGKKFATPSVCARCTPDTIPKFGTVCPLPCKIAFSDDYWNPISMIEEEDSIDWIEQILSTPSELTGLIMRIPDIDPMISPLSGIRVGDKNQMHNLIHHPDKFESAYSGFSSDKPNEAALARMGLYYP